MTSWILYANTLYVLPNKYYESLPLNVAARDYFLTYKPKYKDLGSFILS